MGFFGKILAMPIRIVNLPLKACESLIDPEEDCKVTQTVEKIAKEVEKVDGEE